MKNEQFLKYVEIQTYYGSIIPVEHIVVDSLENFYIFLDKKYMWFYLFILKNHVLFQFDILTDVTGVFNLKHKNNFYDVVYEILSLRYNTRLRVKISAKNNSVFSISDIYCSANWSECELWDMYGIYSENHERLTRLLTDYGFEGHPLKKDFPLTGYYDIRYNESKKRVIVDKLELVQDYRIFDYKISSNNKLF